MLLHSERKLTLKSTLTRPFTRSLTLALLNPNHDHNLNLTKFLLFYTYSKLYYQKNATQFRSLHPGFSQVWNKCFDWLIDWLIVILYIKGIQLCCLFRWSIFWPHLKGSATYMSKTQRYNLFTPGTLFQQVWFSCMLVICSVSDTLLKPTFTETPSVECQNLLILHRSMCALWA